MPRWSHRTTKALALEKNVNLFLRSGPLTIGNGQVGTVARCIFVHKNASGLGYFEQEKILSWEHVL